MATTGLRWLSVLVVGALVSLVTPLHASIEIFLKLDPIQGEATEIGHQGEIEVLSWSWGMTQSVAGSGGGTASGTVSLQSLSLTKYTDTATAPLMAACAKGAILPTATVTVRSLGGSTFDFYQFELKNLQVSSVSQSGSEGEDRLIETVTFNVSNVKVLYYPSLYGLPQPGFDFSWDATTDTGNQASQIPFDPANGAAYIADFGAQLTFAEGAPIVTLTWSSVAGATYQVLLSDSIEGPFQNYGSFPAAGGGTTSINLPANAARKFFRVEQIPGN